MALEPSSMGLPRVLIVSRRSIRKNKFIDFVGEYHLDLLVLYGATPIIVPRVSGIHKLLDSFEPIHGVPLCEGEDIHSSLYESENSPCLQAEELEEVRRLHPSDTIVDHEKDQIELRLANLCMDRNIPLLGICRGSQLLNVACGGTLYQDVGKELAKDGAVRIDYGNYYGHRHAVKVVEGTPLHSWFGRTEISVNSYHHRGIRKLAGRFVPMAVANDGLIEAFYDPKAGSFLMGLQFHPERMRSESGDFDHPGFPLVYQESVRAVTLYQKVGDLASMPAFLLRPHQYMDEKTKAIIQNFYNLRNVSADEQSSDGVFEANTKSGSRPNKIFAMVRRWTSFHQQKLKSEAYD